MEQFGATPLADGGCRFAAWAPALPQLSLVLFGSETRVVPMQATRCGFFVTEAEASAGAQYKFRLPDGRELPDPSSRFQPDGVHGASAVVDHRKFRWTDKAFRGHSLKEMIIYELHIGTFTEEGTFSSAVHRLDLLADLGITTVEIMPVAQFPGGRNWGYDGVYPFAAQNTYGGPDGLQQFVDAAHALGISVILDVVYNHLGPEGNYLSAFGPFFTDRYHTPWGDAINYDEALSDPVREYFFQNALWWLGEFHIDALRLDAVHGIFDFGAHHFLAEMKERVQELAAQSGRTLHLIAESDLNDARLLHCASEGGYALDAQWSDDFHHSIHTLLTGETSGYYADFGSIEDLEVVLREGWRYSGQYSRYRKRRHGNSPVGTAPERFVVCSQNHDQVGNRAAGDRLSQLVDFESLKLAAGITLLSQFVPLLFMGEEYGETRPFQYFTSHLDARLVEAVRRGRREEFAAFGWHGDLPDPQSEDTFNRSVLDHMIRETEPHATLWRLYKRLIEIRKRFGLGGRKPKVSCQAGLGMLGLDYSDGTPLVVLFHFGARASDVELSNGPFRTVLNSSKVEATDPHFEGGTELMRGSATLGPHSFMVLVPARQEN